MAYRGPRFDARWPGTCTDCGEDFDEGDPVGYVPGVDGIHDAACADELTEED